MKRFDKERILSESDALTVADYIGMETKDKGSRISILCPRHNDRNFGSAFLDKDGKGYTCYVCGEHHDTFQMVRDFMGISFPEAVKTVAEACSIGDIFIEREEEHLPTILDRETLSFIGIKPPAKVWVNVGTSFDRPKLEKGERFIYEYTPTGEEEGYYIIQKCIDKNPLLTLKKESPEEYQELIKNKAGETMVFYTLWENICKDKDFKSAIHELKLEAESLFIEYGGEVEKKHNVFSNLL